MITLQDVMKVIDIHHSDISKQTINWLKNEKLVYSDTEMEEHLYSTDIEPYEIEEVLPSVRAELEELATLAGNNDAAYVRVIY